MLHLFYKITGNERDKILQFGIALPLALIVFSAGCTVRNKGERIEAVALARLLQSIVPEAKQLQLQERHCASELRITLDESARADFREFRARFDASIEPVIAIRDRRKLLQEKVRQGVWESPLVYAVQQDAIAMFQDVLLRNETWLQIALNVRTRAELGRQRDFPEVAFLSRQLELFIGEIADEPLASQIQTLKNEYRIGDPEISH